MQNPYVTGSYVTGAQHYGREELVEMLLREGGRAYWITGARRTGRTSLLHQLKLVAANRDRFIPLLWDLQGCTSSLVLGRYLAGAVHDLARQLEAIGLPPGLLQEEDALTLLTHLRRLALRSGRELLLLCDEAEALVDLARTEPEFAQRLHREISAAGLRTVVVSTRRAYKLYDICAPWPGPSFLSGFDMTCTLGHLPAAPAKSLITQSQAPRGSRVKAPAAVIAAIRDATDGHPFLLQSLCAALYDGQGGLRMPGPADLRVSPAMAAMFEYDWAQLAERERRVLLAVAAAEQITAGELQQALGDGEDLLPSLASLQAQGFILKTGIAYRAGSAFLASWLRAEGSRLGDAPASQTSETAFRAVEELQADRGVGALAEQLNARRGRLVELEELRAAQLVHTPSQVLAEIAQLEIEIAALRSLVVRRASV